MNIDELLELARPDVVPAPAVVERHRAMVRTLTEGSAPTSAPPGPAGSARSPGRRGRSTEWPRRPRWSLALLAIVVIVGAGATVIAVAARRHIGPGAVGAPPTSGAAPAPTVPAGATTATTDVEATPSPTSAVSTSTLPTVIIPAPEGPDDTRRPVERFIGVPADPQQAIVRSTRATQQAWLECVRDAGVDGQFTFSDDGGRLPTDDTLTAILSAEEWAEFTTASAQCDQQASRRTTIEGTMATEYAELGTALMSDSRAVELFTASAECLEAAGGPSATNVSNCPEDPRWKPLLHELAEQYDPAWIAQHYDRLVALRDDISGLIARADDPETPTTAPGMTLPSLPNHPPSTVAPDPPVTVQPCPGPPPTFPGCTRDPLRG